MTYLFVNWKGALEIANGAVHVNDVQETEHSIRGEAGFGRLLIRSDHPMEVIRQEKLICSGDTLQLSAVLFPNLYPMLSHWDEC